MFSWEEGYKEKAMMEELEALRAATVKAILNAEDIDKPYLVIRCYPVKKFTRRELAQEIELKTETGNSIVKSIMLLATDLILRQKREI